MKKSWVIIRVVISVGSRMIIEGMNRFWFESNHAWKLRKLCRFTGQKQMFSTFRISKNKWFYIWIVCFLQGIYFGSIVHTETVWCMPFFICWWLIFFLLAETGRLRWGQHLEGMLGLDKCLGCICLGWFMLDCLSTIGLVLPSHSIPSPLFEQI